MSREKEIVTTNLADFGSREWLLLFELVKAKMEQGLPEDFCQEGVQIAMNRNSGFVFFTNEEYQLALMNGSKLETWYNCGNCGREGFKEDCQLTEEGYCDECDPYKVDDEEEEAKEGQED